MQKTPYSVLNNFPFLSISKWPLILLLCAYSNNICKAQNLVPNPSFEEYTDCPVGYPDLDGKCNYWTSFRGSPDYINNCSSNIGFDNRFGYQAARTGLAYTGIGFFQRTSKNIQEQVGVELATQLEIGVRYYISFYVSYAYKPLTTNIASDKAGALFTSYRYNDSNLNYPLPNNCQVYSNTTITDTLNWVKISGSFVADSAYTYLLLGNFFDKDNTDTIIFGGPPFSGSGAYYYVDDVCVTTDSLYNETWAGVDRDVIQPSWLVCYPNPTTDVLHIKSVVPITLLELINYLGQSVLVSERLNSNNLAIRVNHLAKGHYVLKATSNNQTHFQKILLH